MADIATFQRCFMRAKFSESLDFVRLRRFIFFCRISLCDCRPALFCMLQTPRHRPLIGSSRRQHDLHWVDLIYGWLYVFSTLYGISTHFEPSTFRAHSEPSIFVHSSSSACSLFKHTVLLGSSRGHRQVAGRRESPREVPGFVKNDESQQSQLEPDFPARCLPATSLASSFIP